MKLSNLIELYGNDKVTFQNLDNCMIDASKKKDRYEYKFGTNVPFDCNGTEKLCLIVWMDRDIVKKIIDDEEQ